MAASLKDEIEHYKDMLRRHIIAAREYKREGVCQGIAEPEAPSDFTVWYEYHKARNEVFQEFMNQAAI